MSKKLTYEFVKEQIEKVEGYKLLSTEYVNNNTKLLVQCDNGHEYVVTYANFQQGKRCRACNSFSYEFVKEQIEKDGYKLLSKSYKNVKSKLDIRCPKGHEYKSTFTLFQKGSRCPKCFFKNMSHTYEFVKEQIESVEGYKLLNNEYINATKKLLIKCDKGHEYKITWNNFQQGKRCPICSGNKKYTYIEVKNI